MASSKEASVRERAKLTCFVLLSDDKGRILNTYFSGLRNKVYTTASREKYPKNKHK